MKNQSAEQKPAVHILHTPETQQYLKLVQEGIEEEGVPYYTEQVNDEALILAGRACQASRLGVGIGIDRTQVILHYIKLEDNTPLFTVGVYAENDIIKAIGSNAARLVKGMPFKSVEPDR